MTDAVLPTPHKTGWQKGVSGNPHGRPKGSKNRLAEQLISDLTDAYTECAPELIRRCIDEQPLGLFAMLNKAFAEGNDSQPDGQQHQRLSTNGRPPAAENCGVVDYVR